MQYPEFGTQVGRLKSLWLTLLGMTGLGQGASHSLPTAAPPHESGMSYVVWHGLHAATSMSSAEMSFRSAATQAEACTPGILAGALQQEEPL